MKVRSAIRWEGTVQKWGTQMNRWRVTLKYSTRRYTLDFFTGLSLDRPTTKIVMETLCEDAAMCLDEVFWECGPDIKTALKKQTYRLEKLMGYIPRPDELWKIL